MSIEAEAQVRIDIEWVIAPGTEEEWQHIDCCIAAQPGEPQIGDDDAWWPGRCIA
ncbi:MAG TPA: hypothetical protein VIK33_10015 [Anaerolineae bacterium]